MQKHDITFDALDGPARRERRKDARKRDIVARGTVAGRVNLLCGVEFLQFRGIEAHIIRRVLLQLFNRRVGQRQHTECKRSINPILVG